MEEMYKNHRERVRERIRKESIKNFEDHEILEYILFAFIPRKDTKMLAKTLISRFGSFRGVLQTSPDLLQAIPNMTKNASVFLSTMPSIYHRYIMQEFGEKPLLGTPDAIKEYVIKLFRDSQEEHVYLIAVNSKGRLKECIELGEGTIDECKISTKKIIMLCNNLQSFNVFITHNHPVGGTNPSINDIGFTHWIKNALEILDINLIDHIIVSGEDIFSFRQNGMLTNLNDISDTDKIESKEEY